MLKWLRHLFRFKVLTYADYVQLDDMWWRSVHDSFEVMNSHSLSQHMSLTDLAALIVMLDEFDEAIRWLWTLK
jgi:hypothetical protein